MAFAPSPFHTRRFRRKISPCVHPVLWPELLRRHICDGPQSAARTRHMVRVHFPRGQRFCIFRRTLDETHFGETKIQNLGMAIPSNENVGWFDVPVDDSL